MKGTEVKARLSEKAVLDKTGKGWEEWFAYLDRLGASEMVHKDIVILLCKQFGEEKGWWWQMITVAYEQARGIRVANQRCDGQFEIGVSKVINVSLTKLYNAWTNEKQRKLWLPKSTFTITTATKNKSVRIKWGDGTRVSVDFYNKGANKSQVVVQHMKLADAADGEKRRECWKESIESLRKFLEKS